MENIKEKLEELSTSLEGKLKTQAEIKTALQNDQQAFVSKENETNPQKICDKINFVDVRY